jgi:hypothetical protein
MELSGHSPCLGKWESYLITVPKSIIRGDEEESKENEDEEDEDEGKDKDAPVLA